MNKIYKVKIIFINDKEKIEFVSAEDELKAMDQIFEKYNKKGGIADMKII